MRRFSIGLLSAFVLLMFYGYGATTGDSGVSGQQPAPQTETRAAAPTSGTAPAGIILAQAQQRTGPVAEVAEKSFDFGTMNEDRDYSHAFIIKNAGTSELTIKKVLRG